MRDHDFFKREAIILDNRPQRPFRQKNVVASPVFVSCLSG